MAAKAEAETSRDANNKTGYTDNILTKDQQKRVCYYTIRIYVSS